MRDTISHYKSRALTSKLDLRQVPVSELAKNIKAIKARVDKEIPYGGTSASPEGDALWFYLKNHAMSVVLQKAVAYEPLGPLQAVASDYHSTMQLRALRMFYYLLLICTREVRHLHGAQGTCSKIAKEVCPAASAFIAYLGTLNENQAVAHLEKAPPDTTIGKYAASLEMAFYTGHWSSSFGGKAWGGIAKVLRQFVTGEISAEIMLDTSFALCHNGGPIFNKGMLFGMYGSDIKKILDVQRSGQIPQMIAEFRCAKQFITPEMRAYEKDTNALLDGGLTATPYVDWYMVEACGSVHKYPKEKAYQLANYGPSVFSDKITQIEKQTQEAAKFAHAVLVEAANKAAEKAAIAKAEKYKNLVEIMPDVFVKKNTGRTA